MLGITKSGSRRGMLHWSGCQARRAESRQSHRSWVIWLKQRKMKRRSLTGCLLRKTPIALCEWSWRSSNNDQHSCLQTRSQSQRIPQIPQYLEVCSRHKLSIHRWRTGCNHWANHQLREKEEMRLPVIWGIRRGIKKIQGLLTYRKAKWWKQKDYAGPVPPSLELVRQSRLLMNQSL